MTPPHDHESHPREPSDTVPGGCAGCSRLDRRQFLASASLLSLSALVTGCGDGTIGGPEVIPPFPDVPFTIDPRQVTALQVVGGRTVVQQDIVAPVLVERTTASQYRAWSLVCPHRGTIVTVERDGFRCPNHGALFDGNGVWQSGQPTADLAPVGVRLNADGTLTVGGAPLPPALLVSASSLVFTAVTTSSTDPAAQIVSVSNGGGGVLSSLTVDVAYGPNQPAGWLTAQASSPTAPSELTLRVRRGSLAVGTYTATVTVNAPGNSNGARTIAVVLVVQDATSPAGLVLSASAVAMSLPFGSQSDVQAVQVSNSGGGALTGLVTQIVYGSGRSGWLTASLNATTTPAVVTLRAAAGGLAAGTYTAQVTVSAAGVAARTVTVTLTIAPIGLVVNIAAWPALANVGGVAGSVGNLNATPVAVVRTSATSFAAFSMICPHAGTRVNVMNDSSFRCPNHGALFDGAGVNLPTSPQRTSNLQRLTVTYTPGASTLLVS